MCLHFGNVVLLIPGAWICALGVSDNQVEYLSTRNGICHDMTCMTDPEQSFFSQVDVDQERTVIAYQRFRLCDSRIQAVFGLFFMSSTDTVAR